MTDPNYTHLAFLLDRSGSMETIRSDIEGGFDAFIADQAGQPGRCTVTLAQFDDRYEVVYESRPVDLVPKLDLQPRGMTALLDSIGRLVTDVGAGLAAMPEEKRPGTVIVGIMTDGLENASREWTHPAINALIERQERDYSWTFSYMGANQDAIEVWAGLGIDADRSMTYAPGHSREAMTGYSSSVSRIRAARLAGEGIDDARAAGAYTQSQRDAADGTD